MESINTFSREVRFCQTHLSNTFTLRSTLPNKVFYSIISVNKWRSFSLEFSLQNDSSFSVLFHLPIPTRSLRMRWMPMTTRAIRSTYVFEYLVYGNFDPKFWISSRSIQIMSYRIHASIQGGISCEKKRGTFPLAGIHLYLYENEKILPGEFVSVKWR